MTAAALARGALHGGLALATFLSMLLAQAPRRPQESWWQLALAWPSDPGRLVPALPFAATLMAILLAHELGHLLLARRAGARLPLPLFIPAPMFFFGTLGAIVPSRALMPNRSALLRMAVGGPVAGMMVALPAAAWGLAHSSPLGGEALVQGASGLVLGDSMLFALCERHFGPGGLNLRLHPVALAAWAGFFFTSLNLLPAGQLDGGHIAYALCRRGHRWLSRAVVAGLLALGLLGAARGDGGQIWWVWAVMLGLFGLAHPAVARPERPLAEVDRWWAVAALGLLAATFVPAPAGPAVIAGGAGGGPPPAAAEEDGGGEEFRL